MCAGAFLPRHWFAIFSPLSGPLALRRTFLVAVARSHTGFGLVFSRCLLQTFAWSGDKDRKNGTTQKHVHGDPDCPVLTRVGTHDGHSERILQRSVERWPHDEHLDELRFSMDSGDSVQHTALILWLVVFPRSTSVSSLSRRERRWAGHRETGSHCLLSIVPVLSQDASGHTTRISADLGNGPQHTVGTESGTDHLLPIAQDRETHHNGMSGSFQNELRVGFPRARDTRRVSEEFV